MGNTVAASAAVAPSYDYDGYPPNEQADSDSQDSGFVLFSELVEEFQQITGQKITISHGSSRDQDLKVKAYLRLKDVWLEKSPIPSQLQSLQEQLQRIEEEKTILREEFDRVKGLLLQALSDLDIVHEHLDRERVENERLTQHLYSVLNPPSPSSDQQSSTSPLPAHTTLIELLAGHEKAIQLERAEKATMQQKAMELERKIEEQETQIEDLTRGRDDLITLLSDEIKARNVLATMAKRFQHVWQVTPEDGDDDALALLHKSSPAPPVVLPLPASLASMKQSSSSEVGMVDRNRNKGTKDTRFTVSFGGNGSYRTTKMTNDAALLLTPSSEIHSEVKEEVIDTKKEITECHVDGSTAPQCQTDSDLHGQDKNSLHTQASSLAVLGQLLREKNSLWRHLSHVERYCMSVLVPLFCSYDKEADDESDDDPAARREASISIPDTVPPTVSLLMSLSQLGCHRFLVDMIRLIASPSHRQLFAVHGVQGQEAGKARERKRRGREGAIMGPSIFALRRLLTIHPEVTQEVLKDQKEIVSVACSVLASIDLQDKQQEREGVDEGCERDDKPKVSDKAKAPQRQLGSSMLSRKDSTSPTSLLILRHKVKTETYQLIATLSCHMEAKKLFVSHHQLIPFLVSALEKLPVSSLSLLQRKRSVLVVPTKSSAPTSLSFLSSSSPLLSEELHQQREDEKAALLFAIANTVVRYPAAKKLAVETKGHKVAIKMALNTTSDVVARRCANLLASLAFEEESLHADLVASGAVEALIRFLAAQTEPGINVSADSATSQLSPPLAISPSFLLTFLTSSPVSTSESLHILAPSVTSHAHTTADASPSPHGSSSSLSPPLSFSLATKLAAAGAIANLSSLPQHQIHIGSKKMIGMMLTLLDLASKPPSDFNSLAAPITPTGLSHDSSSQPHAPHLNSNSAKMLEDQAKLLALLALHAQTILSASEVLVALLYQCQTLKVRCLELGALDFLEPACNFLNQALLLCSTFQHADREAKVPKSSDNDERSRHQPGKGRRPNDPAHHSRTRDEDQGKIMKKRLVVILRETLCLVASAISMTCKVIASISACNLGARTLQGRTSLVLLLCDIYEKYATTSNYKNAPKQTPIEDAKHGKSSPKAKAHSPTTPSHSSPSLFPNNYHSHHQAQNLLTSTHVEAEADAAQQSPANAIHIFDESSVPFAIAAALAAIMLHAPDIDVALTETSKVSQEGLLPTETTLPQSHPSPKSSMASASSSIVSSATQAPGVDSHLAIGALFHRAVHQVLSPLAADFFNEKTVMPLWLARVFQKYWNAAKEERKKTRKDKQKAKALERLNKSPGGAAFSQGYADNGGGEEDESDTDTIYGPVSPLKDIKMLGTDAQRRRGAVGSPRNGHAKGDSTIKQMMPLVRLSILQHASRKASSLSSDLPMVRESNKPETKSREMPEEGTDENAEGRKSSEKELTRMKMKESTESLEQQYFSSSSSDDEESQEKQLGFRLRGGIPPKSDEDKFAGKTPDKALQQMAKSQLSRGSVSKETARETKSKQSKGGTVLGASSNTETTTSSQMGRIVYSSAAALGGGSSSISSDYMEVFSKHSCTGREISLHEEELVVRD